MNFQALILFVLSIIAIALIGWIGYKIWKKGFENLTYQDGFTVLGIVVAVIAIFATIPNVSNNQNENEVPSLSPTPIQNTGKAIFYDPLQVEKYFPSGNDADGRSWYDDDGYNMLTRDTKAGWIWVVPGNSFNDLIMEVDVMPVTKDSITGYSLIVGWEKVGDLGNFYSFQVRPDGSCDFFRHKSNRAFGQPFFSCPKPSEDSITTVRVEVPAPNDDITCMRGFIDDEYIGENCFSDYDGGLIGLGVYNGGSIGSGVEAQVRFYDLTVWRPPRN